MAVVRIPDENRTLRDADAIRDFLAAKGIDYERWTPNPSVSPASSTDALLAANAATIETLKARGGYVTADVVDVKPDTPNLDAMLAKFSTEHWHDEDEVRLIVEGRGLFHVHPRDGAVFAIEVEAGDLIRVPRGTHHWFDLCGDRRIRAVRLFQDQSGWTPHYTQSGVDSQFQPVCFGPAYFSARTSRALVSGADSLSADLPRAIVLDIEGTTTPISFVYEVLFPFARKHLRGFLAERWDSVEVQDAVRRLYAEWSEDVRQGAAPPQWVDAPSASQSSAAAYLDWLMDRDRKSPALKLLQGYVWERGYHAGELHGEVFPDVAPAIERWRRSGVKVAIYSSGSVLAQRLIFGHTTHGDLVPLFTAFFDTATGPKTSPDSYLRIAAALDCPPDGLLFVSDAITELSAARAAGCRVRLCIRPGNGEQGPRGTIPAINRLDEIPFG